MTNNGVPILRYNTEVILDDEPHILLTILAEGEEDTKTYKITGRVLNYLLIVLQDDFREISDHVFGKSSK